VSDSRNNALLLSRHPLRARSVRRAARHDQGHQRSACGRGSAVTRSIEYSIKSSY